VRPVVRGRGPDNKCFENLAQNLQKTSECEGAQPEFQNVSDIYQLFAAKLLSTDHSNLKKAVVEHKALLRSGAV
jgi:hypothetical protein